MCTLLLPALLALQAVAPQDEIRATLVNRVDEARKAMSIVVGTVGPGGRSVTAYGRLAKDSPRTPDGDTVFEIGSITKVFTSLLLADMIERGEVKADTPVASLLPEGVRVPERNGRKITLLDISMQVSGLPRMPSNFSPANPSNPYADYGPKQLYEFLGGYTLPRDPGEKYEYSNVAVGLLGHALARKAGMSYEELVRQRILVPLGMTSTSITLSADQKARLAPGHTATLGPAPNWDLDAMAGAGALRSTANDMLKFLAANLGLTESPLKPAMARMCSVRRPAGAASLEIAMGWHILTAFGDVFWHNGGTGGYRSFAGFRPETKSAVVVLTNTSFDVDDIGRHTLDARYPAAKLPAPKQRVEVQVPAETLGRYAGEYRITPAFALQITLDGGRLYAQATAQPRFEVFAESPTDFFYKVVDAQLTFVAGADGKVTHLVLHQNGLDLKFQRTTAQ